MADTSLNFSFSARSLSADITFAESKAPASTGWMGGPVCSIHSSQWQRLCTGFLSGAPCIASRSHTACTLSRYIWICSYQSGSASFGCCHPYLLKPSSFPSNNHHVCNLGLRVAAGIFFIGTCCPVVWGRLNCGPVSGSAVWVWTFSSGDGGSVIFFYILLHLHVYVCTCVFNVRACVCIHV